MPPSDTTTAEIEPLRQEARRRRQAGQGVMEITRALSVSKGFVYHALRAPAAADPAIPADCSWGEVSRRLGILIRRIEKEDGPFEPNSIP